MGQKSVRQVKEAETRNEALLFVMKRPMERTLLREVKEEST